jgi:CRISPR-associated protein Csx3
MQTNPFPAILLAGPPHSGKSVLSFLLTEQLRQMRVPHYLLRAAPDNEGDWFFTGDLEAVRILRARDKRGFTKAFVAQQRQVIEKRWLPLLVDIGGRPQGEQFDLIRACTHSVLLYPNQDDYTVWRAHLADAGLLPVAELHSQLKAPDRITQDRPVLTGVISGLQREKELRRAAATFGALLDRIAGIFQTDEASLERIHLPLAPWPVLLERDLAREVGIPLAQKIYWKPENLAQLERIVPAGQSYALYGRGPVWLAAMLAVRALPASFAFFDARFGWLETPAVHQRGTKNCLDVTYTQYGNGLWADLRLPKGGVLEPGPLTVTAPPAADGIILSGKLPRWAFAALTRAFAKKQTWIATDDPNSNRAIVVFSRSESLPVSSLLPRA